MRKQRKNYTPQQKVFILKRHQVDRIPVSDLCGQDDLLPNVFYRWQKEFFENGASAFENKQDCQNKAELKRIEKLEAKLQTKNGVLSELMEEHVKLKRNMGNSDGVLGSPCIRDAVIDFVQYRAEKSGIAATRYIEWLAVAPSKYYNWQSRYGKVNEHNGLIHRDFRLEESEKQAIVIFLMQYPLAGCRRLTYMMLDRNIVAVSPSSVYRVLSTAGLLIDFVSLKEHSVKKVSDPVS